MEFYVSHHIGNFIIPTDELTFFRGVYHQPDDDLIVDFVFSARNGDVEWIANGDPDSCDKLINHDKPIAINVMFGYDFNEFNVFKYH